MREDVLVSKATEAIRELESELGLSDCKVHLNSFRRIFTEQARRELKSAQMLLSSVAHDHRSGVSDVHSGISHPVLFSIYALSTQLNETSDIKSRPIAILMGAFASQNGEYSPNVDSNKVPKIQDFVKYLFERRQPRLRSDALERSPIEKVTARSLWDYFLAANALIRMDYSSGVDIYLQHEDQSEHEHGPKTTGSNWEQDYANAVSEKKGSIVSRMDDYAYLGKGDELSKLPKAVLESIAHAASRHLRHVTCQARTMWPLWGLAEEDLQKFFEAPTYLEKKTILETSEKSTTLQADKLETFLSSSFPTLQSAANNGRYSYLNTLRRAHLVQLKTVLTTLRDKLK